jgi:RES domain-containing protein
MIYSGLTWCHVPAGSHPLHLARILRAEGRWNEAGAFGALYLCTEEGGAVAEYEKAVERGEVEGEHHLASVLISHLQPVENLASHAGDRDDLQRELLTRDDPASLAYCRNLARQSRQRGFAGVLVPSAALPGSVNLVVYLDVVPPSQLDVIDGPHRRSL